MRLEEKVSRFAWGEILCTLPVPAGLEKGLASHHSHFLKETD